MFYLSPNNCGGLSPLMGIMKALARVFKITGTGLQVRIY